MHGDVKSLQKNLNKLKYLKLEERKWKNAKEVVYTSSTSNEISLVLKVAL